MFALASPRTLELQWPEERAEALPSATTQQAALVAASSEAGIAEARRRPEEVQFRRKATTPLAATDRWAREGQDHPTIAQVAAVGTTAARPEDPDLEAPVSLIPSSRMCRATRDAMGMEPLSSP